jgi:hypothetical protein
MISAMEGGAVKVYTAPARDGPQSDRAFRNERMLYPQSQTSCEIAVKLTNTRPELG